jgi:pimeloyl-ACP methyl ester carboxylesterase
MRRRARLPLGLPVLIASALYFSACGDPAVVSEPSPEAIETAESIARDVRIDAPYSTTPTPDDAEQEPIVLDARVFGSGEVGVILAHMRPSDQSSWFPFATKLADEGAYTAITFDFRGYGESTGEKQFDRIDTDLSAVYEYARETLGLDEIFLVGASMGGTAALVSGARDDVSGVVSISALGQLPEIDAQLTVAGISAPKLFIVSEDDVPQFRSQEELWALARAPKDQHIYPGDDHGTDIFAGEHGADLEQRIIDFIELNSPSVGAR